MRIKIKTLCYIYSAFFVGFFAGMAYIANYHFRIMDKLGILDLYTDKASGLETALDSGMRDVLSVATLVAIIIILVLIAVAIANHFGVSRNLKSDKDAE